MPTTEAEKFVPELEKFIDGNKITWGEERVRNLGATVESLMQRRGFNPAEFDDVDEGDFADAA
jgi:hypothetical protein